MLVGVWTGSQDWDQPARLEPDGAQRRHRHPAESASGLAPAPQIVRSRHARPGDVVIHADLMLNPVAGGDVRYDKCHVPCAQLVSEFPGKFAG